MYLRVSQETLPGQGGMGLENKYMLHFAYFMQDTLKFITVRVCNFIYRYSYRCLKAEQILDRK